LRSERTVVGSVVPLQFNTFILTGFEFVDEHKTQIRTLENRDHRVNTLLFEPWSVRSVVETFALIHE
jgi:hypothetical protein